MSDPHDSNLRRAADFCRDLGRHASAEAISRAIGRIAALEAALAERTKERDDLAHDVKRHLAIVASVEAELDTAIRRAEALAVVLREARAAIAPPSVVFAAGYPLPAHLRMTAERAQLLGRIDAAIDAARGDKP